MSDATFQDKTLNCPDCKLDFILTAGEQAWFADPSRGYTPPKRCKPCRNKRKMEKEGGYNNTGGYSSGQGPGPGPRPVQAAPPAPSNEFRENKGGGRGKRRRRDDYSGDW